MELVLDTDKYNQLLKTRLVSGNFLQSNVWRDFLNKQGLRSWRATVLDNNKAVGILFADKILLNLV